MRFILVSILVLFLFNKVVAQCYPVNYGISSEKLEYDSVNKEKGSQFFDINTDGYINSGVVISTENDSVIVTTERNQLGQLISITEHDKTFDRTETWKVKRWTDDNLILLQVNSNDSTAYRVFEYLNCKLIYQRTYADNELLLQRNLIWENNLVKKSVSIFYGELKESLRMNSSTTSYDYKKINHRGDWTERTVIHGDEEYREYRTITYHN